MNILITWEAWYWVESLAKTLGLFFVREGYQVFTNSEYENRIRGWHIFNYVRISDSSVKAYSEEVDILLVMDSEIKLHLHKLKKDWVLIYDPLKVKEVNHTRTIKLEMQDISSKVIWMPLARNVVWAWSILWVLGYKSDNFKEALTEIFRKKWPEIIALNHKAFDLGYEVAIQSGIKAELAQSQSNTKRFMMHGNEAIVLWAIKAWMKYLSAYPMTPWSSIMTTAAKEAKNFNLVVSHVEDEIAAICNAIWAGYAWVRAMTCTSWWWFALMWEAIWLAWMIEAPVVIVDAQRPWPSTWLPTLTWQWDLRMAIHCWQGDVPRMVVAPWDHEECISLAFEAFNYADKYQIPVIILTEKYLADAYKSIDFIDFSGWKVNRWEFMTWDKRYELTASWISPRSIPWMPGKMYTATSYEHDEYGKADKIEYNQELIAQMQEKRGRKVDLLKQSLPLPEIYGNGNILIVCWWACKWVIEEVVDLMPKYACLHIKYLYPFKEEIGEILTSYDTIIVVESNYLWDLSWLIREKTWIKPHKEIRTYNWKQITATYIIDQLNGILS